MVCLRHLRRIVDGKGQSVWGRPPHIQEKNKSVFFSGCCLLLWQKMLRACIIAVALSAATAATIHSKHKRYNTAGKIVPGAINVHLVPHR
jgi:hypothetical protein